MSITYWWSEDRKWFCILADDGVCKSTVSLTQKEARDLTAAAAAETSPGDVVAVRKSIADACRAAAWPTYEPDNTLVNDSFGLTVGELRRALAAIDRLDVKAEAEVDWWQEARKLISERLDDLSAANALYGKDQRLNAPEKIERNNREITWLKDLRSVLTHPTTKPEAPAVSVDAIARLIDPDSFCLCDETGGLLRTVECDEATTKATAIAALIAGGR